MSKQPTKRTGKERKTRIIEDLKSKLDKAKSFFFVDYMGLTHQQLETLRKSLKKVDAEIMIVKNTLLKKALAEKKIIDAKEKSEKVEAELKNTTAAFFAYGDDISAIKSLADFAKGASLPKVKIGFFSKDLATGEDFNKLATLPSFDMLIQMLVSRLVGPLYGFAYSLSWNMQKLVITLNNVRNVKK